MIHIFEGAFLFCCVAFNSYWNSLKAILALEFGHDGKGSKFCTVFWNCRESSVLKKHFFTHCYVFICHLSYVLDYRWFWSIINMEILICCFHLFLAEIFSSGKVHIWTRCEIIGAYNFTHCCSCRSFLCLCCQKTIAWFFWPLGDFHNGCCSYFHNLCESFTFICYKYFLFFLVYCIDNPRWLEEWEALLSTSRNRWYVSIELIC